MALNPLSIAHLGFACKPLVAAMLGLWDEIVAAIAEIPPGGKRRKRVILLPPVAAPIPVPRRPIDEDEAILMLLRAA